MPAAMGQCGRDPLHHTFNIGVFKSVEKNFAPIKHTYNESVNTIQGCNVALDTSDCWIFP